MMEQQLYSLGVTLGMERLPGKSDMHYTEHAEATIRAFDPSDPWIVQIPTNAKSPNTTLADAERSAREQLDRLIRMIAADPREALTILRVSVARSPEGETTARAFASLTQESTHPGLWIAIPEADSLNTVYEDLACDAARDAAARLLDELHADHRPAAMPLRYTA